MATMSSTPISSESVETAIKALLKWKECNPKSEKPQLLNSDDFLYLVVTLKKIPPKGRTNAYKIPLIHPLFDGSSELCLLLDDRPGRRPSSRYAKDKVDSESIPVSKVIKLSKLKSDYKPFEAKRKLCDSYDLFLADRRIIPLLPKHLGKNFFKKKKLPVPVDLEHQNWKEQVERVCKSALLHLKTGTCSALRVARASMPPEHIVENVVSSINGVAETVPRKWKNVRSLHLKLSDSVALPVYQSAPEANLKIIGLDHLVKKDAGAVVVLKRGREEGVDALSSSKASSKKGRIHQVRYMDDQLVSEDLDIDDNVDDAEEQVPPPKKPKQVVKGKKVEADGAKIKKANKVRKVSNVAKSASAKKPKRS